jgi:hypothetical protein
MRTLNSWEKMSMKVSYGGDTLISGSETLLTVSQFEKMKALQRPDACELHDDHPFFEDGKLYLWTQVDVDRSRTDVGQSDLVM